MLLLLGVLLLPRAASAHPCQYMPSSCPTPPTPPPPSVSEYPSLDGSYYVTAPPPSGYYFGLISGAGQYDQSRIDVSGQATGQYKYYAEYCLDAGSYNKCGNSSATTVTVVRTPGTPSIGNLSAAALCQSGWTVDWTPGGSIPTGAERNYRLQQSIDGGSWSTVSSDLTESHKSLNIDESKSYRYRVSSRDEYNGYYSSWTGYDYTNTVTTLRCTPGKPDAPSVARTGMSVAVNWSAPSAGKVESYRLQRRGRLKGESAWSAWETISNGNVLTYTDSESGVHPLVQGYEYQYQVQAENDESIGDQVSGWSNASVAVYVPYAPPPAPNLDDTVGGAAGYNGVYNIAWSSAGGTVGGFKFQQAESNNATPVAGDWTATIEDVPSNSPQTRSYDQPANFSGAIRYYHYRVKAYNADAEGGWVTVSVALNYYPQPGAVDTFEQVGMATLAGSYTLRWEPPSGDEDVTHYKLDRLETAGVEYPNIADTGQTQYTQTLTGGASGQTYHHAIQACFQPNEPGAEEACSGYTGTLSVYIPYSVPSTPANFTGPDGSLDGSFEIAWSASTSGTVDHYELEETVNGSSNIINRGMATGFSRSGVNGHYEFRVRACSPDANGPLTPAQACSPWSAKISFNAFTTPAEFEYSLNDTSFLPNFGEGELVALTQGKASVSNGAAQYTVPIVLPPAVNGLKPELALHYNSRGGNGLLGVGWSLAGLSLISRCTLTVATEGDKAQDSNPRYTNADRLCLDGKKLEIATSIGPASDSAYWASNAEYRTEIDSFARIQAVGAHESFKVWTKSGRILTYGLQAEGQNSRIHAPGQAGGPISVWALDKVEDRYGNEYTIHYQRNTADGDYYPTHIDFSPNASVVFSYVDRDADSAGYRSDVPYGYDKGHLHKHVKLLDKITTYIDGGGTAVREYDINYERSATTHRYLIEAITECGFEGSSRMCSKPLQFDWQDGELGFEAQPADLLDANGGILWALVSQAVDIDGDAYVDLLSASAVRWGDANGRFSANASIAAETGPGAGLMTTLAGQQLIGGTDEPARFGVAALQPGYSGSVSYHELSGMGFSKHMTFDVNNDGLDDILTASTLWIQQATDPVSFVSHALPESVNMKETALTDFNSDGLVDYLAGDKAYRNTGTGFVAENVTLPLSDSGEVTLYIPMYGNNTTMRMPGTLGRSHVDVNGDGKLDLMYHYEADGESEGRWYLRMNTGNGFGPEIDTGISAGNQRNQYAFPYDWDKDGRQDLIVETQDNNAWRILLSGYDNGQPRFNVLSVDPFADKYYKDGYNVSAALAGMYMAVGAAQVFRGDFNNDGLVDLFFWWGNQIDPPKIWYAKRQQPDLLTAVTDGLGAQVTLEYSPLVDDDNHGQPLYTPSSTKPVFPQRHAPRNMQVVKKLSVSDGQGGWREQYYNYVGAKQDAQGRGFLGFEKITVTDTAKGIVATTAYRQDFPFIGSVASVEIKDTAGQLIRRVDNDYAVHSQNGRFPYRKESLTRDYGLTTISLANPLSVQFAGNTFDAYGNLTDRITTVGTGLDSGGITGVQRIEIVDNEIANNVAGWLLGFVTQRTETFAEAGGANARTVVTQFEPRPGTLDVQVRRDFVGTPAWKITVTARNANGIPTEVAVLAGDIDGGTAATRSTTWSNFADTMYPQTQTNAKGHATTLTYDTRFGTINSQIDPNTLTATREYDAFGRLVNETASDGTVTAVKRFYCASAPVICPSDAAYLSATEVTNSNAAGQLGAPLTITYYDKLMREVRTQTYSLNGAVIKVDTEYYADGRVYRVSEPYTGTSASHWTANSNYDALNRPHDIGGADGGSVHYDYTQESGSQKTVETVTVVTPEGSREQTATRYTNALGQVKQVLDDAGTPIDYTYDTHGNLKTTTVNNDAATTVTIVHDMAGNKTYIKDPDAGKIDFEYNGFGELRRQTWQKGTAAQKSMTYTYDVLGRKTGRTDTPDAGTPVSYTWTWDTLKKGLLTSRASTNNDFTETYAYDSQARLSGQTTAITGLGTRTFGYTYDVFGRPRTVTYPDGLKVEHQYHAVGIQARTRDVTDPLNPKILWTIGEDSDTRGNFTQQRFGNGVITLSSFDIESGQISGIKTGWPTAGGLTGLVGNIQDLAYEFDTLGNLYERTTGRTDIHGAPEEYTTEFFSYDDLNRLKTSDTTWLGIGERPRSYDYDELGNLTERSDIGTLIYDQTNNAGVHAVTSANGQNYQYDPYGNMVQRGGDSVDYDVFNKPTRIGSTYFSYGPDHARFKQVNGDRTTYYVNGGLYEEIVEGGVTTQKSYIGGYLVRSTKSGQTGLTYLHKDHLGSVEAMTDQWGNLVDRMSFDPWGMRQYADWADGNPTGGDPDYYPTTRGYTGHEMLDQEQLIHMNGRVYDPVIGRFLSPDLYIQAPYNTQSFNRYSYVFNNPLSLVDPSGYDAECGSQTPNEVYSQKKPCNASKIEKPMEEVVTTGTPPPPPPPPTLDQRAMQTLYATLYFQAQNGGWIMLDGQKVTVNYDPVTSDSNNQETLSGKPCSAICNSVPQSPENADLDANIDLAGRMSLLNHGPIRAPRWFKKKVQNKGEWDYKQQGSEYEEFGNFNYGATGSALGLSTGILLRAAGWAQGRAGTSASEWGGWDGDAPYGDDPLDQYYIQQGVDYYDCGCGSN